MDLEDVSAYTLTETRRQALFDAQTRRDEQNEECGEDGNEDEDENEENDFCCVCKYLGIEFDAMRDICLLLCQM